MTLNYLDFDYSEDTEGIGVFDAMASTGPLQVPAVHAEIVAVLDWAHATFSERRGPVGDGGEWDYDLHGMRETSAPETIDYDPATRSLRVQAGPAAAPRHTVSLSIGGTAAFCAAFRSRFEPDPQ
ncbi:MAG: hypothetical protein WKG52_08085 [Variovorax sp.]